MNDRITRIERLAALHREGALTDDEFRDEKLRVLSGRATSDEPLEEGAEIAARPSQPPPVVSRPAPPIEPIPAFFEEEVTEEPEPLGDPYAPEPRGRSRAPWWVGGLLVLVVALVGAVWFARSITVADAPRSSVGTAAPRRPAPPQDPLPDEVTVEEEPTDVSNALAFSNAGQCEFAGQAERAFEALLSRRGGEWTTDGPVRLGAMTLTPRLEVKRSTDDDGMTSASYYSTARAPDGVLWNGLKLSRLVHSLNLPAETDSLEERSITFLEEPERVQRALRDLGVSVPVGEGYRELEDGACGGSMQIKAIPGGSALVCQWGC